MNTPKQILDETFQKAGWSAPFTSDTFTKIILAAMEEYASQSNARVKELEDILKIERRKSNNATF